MALTAKKELFAQAKLNGADNKEAAIQAGSKPNSAAAAGTRWEKDPDVIAYIERHKNVKPVNKVVNTEPKSVTTKNAIQTAANRADPLAFLEEIWTDPVEDMKLRLDAAKAALPYFHGKVAEKGKKETKADDAKKATQGGKFGTLNSQLPS